MICTFEASVLVLLLAVKHVVLVLVSASEALVLVSVLRLAVLVFKKIGLAYIMAYCQSAEDDSTVLALFFKTKLFYIKKQLRHHEVEK